MGQQRADRSLIPTARSYRGLSTWPPEAITALHAALERKRLGAGQTWAALLADLHKHFGVTWNDSSLSRYYVYWRMRICAESLDPVSRLMLTAPSTPGDDEVVCVPAQNPVAILREIRDCLREIAQTLKGRA